jgi:hypothetical protein
MDGQESDREAASKGAQREKRLNRTAVFLGVASTSPVQVFVVENSFPIKNGRTNS